MVQSTLVAVGAVAQMAVPYTVARYLAELRSTNPDRAGRIFGLLFSFSAIFASGAAIALYSCACWLAGSVLKAPALSSSLAFGSAVLFFAALNGFLISTLAGLEAFRSLAKALMLSGVAYFCICVLFAWQAGLQGAIAGMALSGLIQFLILFFATARELSLQGIRVRYVYTTKEWSVVLNFMLPAALNGLTATPTLWLASTFLVRQANGYSEMALFSASLSLMMVILFLPNTINNVGMSLINHVNGMGNRREYQHAFWINLGANGTIVIAGACAAILFGHSLLHMFGKDFKDGYNVLAILLLATISQGLGLAIYQIIQSQAKMWLSFVAVALPRDTLIIVLAYLLIPKYGARGLASAYAISWTIAALIIGSIVLRIGLAPTGTPNRLRVAL